MLDNLKESLTAIRARLTGPICNHLVVLQNQARFGRVRPRHTQHYTSCIQGGTRAESARYIRGIAPISVVFGVFGGHLILIDSLSDMVARGLFTKVCHKGTRSLASQPSLHEKGWWTTRNLCVHMLYLE